MSFVVEVTTYLQGTEDPEHRSKCSATTTRKERVAPQSRTALLTEKDQDKMKNDERTELIPSSARSPLYARDGCGAKPV